MPSVQRVLHQGLAADKPSADATLNQGWLYFETDTAMLKQSWNGSWVTVNLPQTAAVVALDYVASTDLANGLALSPGVWTDLLPDTAFTLVGTNSMVWVALSVSAVIGNNDSGVSSRLVIDSAGTPIIRKLGGANNFALGYANPFSGAGTFHINTLAAGAHTIKVQVNSFTANQLYCRANSLAEYDFFSLNIIEWPL